MPYSLMNINFIKYIMDFFKLSSILKATIFSIKNLNNDFLIVE